MNETTTPREPLAPQPATALASHRVHPEKLSEYIKAQNAITDAARRFPGFVGTEVLEPVPGLQEEWVSVFRLESNKAMKAWLDSAERKKLAARIEEFVLEPSRVLLLASDERTEPPVAMVFTHKVAPEKVEAYLDWRRRTIAAQAHYPGYLATEFFEPHGQFDEWVDIVRYDSSEDLDDWLNSGEREELLKELEGIVESVHSHRVTGLEGWFSVNRDPGTPAIVPPAWKQALAVLFALYPLVMLLTVLNALMLNLSFAAQILIGNIFSVSILSFFLMPRVSRALGFWINAPRGSWGKEFIGLGIIVVGLILALLFFRATGSIFSPVGPQIFHQAQTASLIFRRSGL